MTRDAKIGLLLGLAFIFVIAFIVNGLPSLRGDKNKDTNELTAGLVNMPKNSPVIGARERELINQRESVNNRIQEFQNVPIMDPLIRYQTNLPQEEGPLMARSSNPSDLQRSNTVKTVDIGQVQVKRPEVEGPRIVTPARPQVYVVKDGDNLSSIALQFYGSEEGNRRAVITALFKANSKVLKSPDDIYVGQKLIIPPLSDLTGEKDKSSGGLASAIFEKVASIGRERLPTKKPEAASGSKSYTVRDGDSLWKIAADQLGDGSRYPEIAKLNGDVLSDEDSLTVGMTLKMPVR
jgi:nucleoid-associated protein YgaU